MAIRDNVHPLTMAMTVTPLMAAGAPLGVHRGCPWIDIARSEVVGQFLTSKEEEILFIDADNYFNVGVVQAMREAKGDIVTCTYRKRTSPHNFNATPLGDQQPHIRRWLEAPRRTVGPCRLVEIASDGMGCCLIQRHVIERMAWLHPNLKYVNDEGQDRHWLFQPFVAADAEGVPRPAGDDRAFFFRARAARFKIECLIDATIFHDGIEGNFGKEVFDRAS